MHILYLLMISFWVSIANSYQSNCEFVAVHDATAVPSKSKPYIYVHIKTTHSRCLIPFQVGRFKSSW